MASLKISKNISNEPIKKKRPALGNIINVSFHLLMMQLILKISLNNIKFFRELV